jgi:hypothetical protein
MVHLAQTMHRSCTDTNTTSKRTETRFHMAHVTKEFHQVCPKWLLSLWYVRRKPCTYLASKLALSQNGLNRASTWASSHRSTFECAQNDFWAYGTFGANRAPIFRQGTDWIELPLEPRHLGVPLGASKMISKPMVCLAQSMQLSCVKISTISKWNETSIHLSLVT